MAFKRNAAHRGGFPSSRDFHTTRVQIKQSFCMGSVWSFTQARPTSHPIFQNQNHICQVPVPRVYFIFWSIRADEQVKPESKGGSRLLALARQECSGKEQVPKVSPVPRLSPRFIWQQQIQRSIVQRLKRRADYIHLHTFHCLDRSWGRDKTIANVTLQTQQI